MSIEKEIQQAEKIEAVPQPAYTPIFKMERAPAPAPKLQSDVAARFIAKQKPAAVAQPGNALYVRGKTVTHVPTRSPVTILKCEGIGKSGAVEYVVVSKKGQKWTAKENDLRPRQPKT